MDISFFSAKVVKSILNYLWPMTSYTYLRSDVIRKKKNESDNKIRPSFIISNINEELLL